MRILDDLNTSIENDTTCLLSNIKTNFLSFCDLATQRDEQDVLAEFIKLQTEAEPIQKTISDEQRDQLKSEMENFYRFMNFPTEEFKSSEKLAARVHNLPDPIKKLPSSPFHNMGCVLPR